MWSWIGSIYRVHNVVMDGVQNVVKDEVEDEVKDKVKDDNFWNFWKFFGNFGTLGNLGKTGNLEKFGTFDIPGTFSNQSEIVILGQILTISLTIWCGMSRMTIILTIFPKISRFRGVPTFEVHISAINGDIDTVLKI